MLILKTPEEIEIMAEGGKRLAEVLRSLASETRAGVTTKQLDRLAYQHIHKLGAKPAFLHYRPTGARKAYPYTLCTSLNDTVVHGQPSDYVVQDGDLVKLDIGLIYKGLYLDSAITVAVGPADNISRETKKLITATQDALIAGIAEARIGKTLGDIGYAIAAVAKKNKCGIAEGLIGHGIGRSLHEDPAVFNFGKRGDGEPLQEGMVIAIEPMFTAGDGATITRKDDSYATRDGSLAAHFEHTGAITKKGPRILTAL
jgi:methionyl aminopeptidase